MKYIYMLVGVLLLANCAHYSNKQESANKNEMVAIVNDYYRAYNNRNIQEQLNLFSDAIVYNTNSGRMLVGHEAYRKYTEGLFAEVNESVVDIKCYADEARSTVVCQSLAIGTYDKAAADLPPARGQRYSIPFVEIFEIDNKKIKKFSTFYNERLWSDQIKKK